MIASNVPSDIQW